MKKVLLVLLFCLSSSLLAELAKVEVLDSYEEVSFEDMITELYNQEVVKEDSVLRKKILEHFTVDSFYDADFVFIVDGDFTLGGAYSEKIHLGDIINTGSGRSGAFYGFDYLVPIMVSSPGSGLMVSTPLFIQVTAYHSFFDYDTGKEVQRSGVIFESLATLNSL